MIFEAVVHDSSSTDFKQPRLGPAYRFLFPIYLLFQLPLAWVAGLRLVSLEQGRCVVRMRHRFWNKNPFGSMYFAAMAMGAEMSTGLPAYVFLRQNRKSVSLLLAGMEADYHKKAVGRLTFEFEDQGELLQALGNLKRSGDACRIVLVSRCYDASKQLMAEFRFTWTFRQR
jgi:hypothetical protein